MTLSMDSVILEHIISSWKRALQQCVTCYHDKVLRKLDRHVQLKGAMQIKAKSKERK